MALCKHMLQTGANFAFLYASFRQNLYSPSSTSNNGYGLFSRQISGLVKPKGNRAFLVDTLALVRGLEAKGVPTKQAEAITAAITEVLNDSLENVSHAFVSKVGMQKWVGPILVSF
ncbi:uncharacterized protein LOC110751625 [Prunus avium]|uniref:Uncharacterized protein LOC110751625 n=1 Tax=Prunus avium TaxID=42229 RepID=A0A6P5S2Z4_PRUAV|nr:uncharacterized protein LOC110751625 [Prunus avium]